MANPATEEVLAYEQHCELKEILGPDFKLGSIITEETIKACEALLNVAADEFFVDAAPDLELLRSLVDKPEAEVMPPAYREEVLQLTFNIKGHAKMLGFTLITDICMHVVHCMSSNKISDKKRYKLIRQLVEALRVAFDHKIRNDGGELGLALRQKLQSTL